MEERPRDERHTEERERWPEERERERVGGPMLERLPVILKHILAEWFRCSHRVAIILVQRGL